MSDRPRLDAAAPALERLGRIRAASRRFITGPTAVLGLGLTAFFVVVALLADVLASGSPFAFVGEPFEPPSGEFWFGTDDLGRSVYSGVVHGARTSLLVGLAVAGAAFLIGTVVGGIAGSAGGWVDDLLMRLTELFQVLPRFFLALVVVALFGASLTNLILVLALTSWVFTARLARAGVLTIKERDYVVAARGLGASAASNLFHHILPNALAPVIVHASLQVGRAILIEAGLSFLGLGDPNVISWGFMLNNAQAFMRTAWWMSVFPGAAIALTVLGVNLLGDALNDYWDPRQRGRRSA